MNRHNDRTTTRWVHNGDSRHDARATWREHARAALEGRVNNRGNTSDTRDLRAKAR